MSLTRWSRLCPRSLIRELRIRPAGVPPSSALPPNLPEAVRRYDEILRAHYHFHRSFWKDNNRRFEAEKTLYLSTNPTPPSADCEAEHLAVFYRSYMIKYRGLFAEYHLETQKRAFRLLWEEYRFALFQLGSLLRNVLARPQPTSAVIVPSFSREN